MSKYGETSQFLLQEVYTFHRVVKVYSLQTCGNVPCHAGIVYTLLYEVPMPGIKSGHLGES